MSMDLEDVQNSIIEYLEDEYPDTDIVDTEFYDTVDEPTTNGILDTYVVIRTTGFSSNLTGGSSFGGPRHDEMYALVDAFVVAHSPGEARKFAYGEGGISDALAGFKPNADSGQLNFRGTRLFTRGTSENSKPKRYVASSEFRLSVNMIMPEPFDTTP